MSLSEKNLRLLEALEIYQGESFTNYQGITGHYFYDRKQPGLFRNTGLFVPDHLLSDIISLMKHVSKHHKITSHEPEPAY